MRLSSQNYSQYSDNWQYSEIGNILSVKCKMICGYEAENTLNTSNTSKTRSIDCAKRILNRPGNLNIFTLPSIFKKHATISQNPIILF